MANGFSCWMRYQSRKILSRPVVLILLWNCMVWITFGTPAGNYHSIVYAISQVDFRNYNTLSDSALYIIPQLLWLLSAFASAYLIRWKFKLADMFLIGVAITGLGIMLDVILSVIPVANKLLANQSWMYALKYLPKGLMFIGSAPVMTILLQLGVEQVPEASAAQISALVSWFALTKYLGSWINNVIYGGFYTCFTSEEATTYLFVPYLKLCGAVLFTIILCSHFAFSHVLLDNSPAYNSARTIYYVLNYAAKHKFPENRSSLTYWEDEPISRINLGKRKYGGPFSSEQVEDTKTFFRMLIIFLSVYFFITTHYLNALSNVYATGRYDEEIQYQDRLYDVTMGCKTTLIYFFTGTDKWWGLVTAIVYEFVLIPVLYFRMPSMLKRIGFSFFVLALQSGYFTALKIIEHYKNYTLPLLYFQLSFSLVMGMMKAIFFISSFEFVFAQAPYNMRNFFIVLAWCIERLAVFTALVVFSVWQGSCRSPVCPVGYSCVMFLLAILAFVLYCLTAKWYQRRTRGHEDEHQQKWVEEAYDRYLAVTNSVSLNSESYHDNI